MSGLNHYAIGRRFSPNALLDQPIKKLTS
ncbi:MAG: hypothetical protein FD189_2478, partial [Elusimicrobia bacterium]